MLPGMVRRPGGRGLVLVLVAVTGWLVAGLGEEFMPNFQENDFLMHWVEKPGTSLAAMRRLTGAPARSLRPVSGAQFGSHIGQRRGRPTRSSARTSPNCGSASIPRPTTPGLVKGDPGGHRRVSRPRSERRVDVPERANQGDPHERTGATVVVRTFGPDMAMLRAKPSEITDGDQGSAGGDRPEGRVAGRGAADST